MADLPVLIHNNIMKAASLFVVLYLLSLPGTTVALDGNTQLECPVTLLPPRPELEQPLDTGEIYITADEQAEITQGGRASLKGNVELARDGHQLRADRARLDQSDNTAEIEGDIHYWNQAIYLHSESARLDLDNNQGSFRQNEYLLTGNQGHGGAEKLAIVADTLSTGTNIDYTTCAKIAATGERTDPAWQISARTLELNHET